MMVRLLMPRKVDISKCIKFHSSKTACYSHFCYVGLISSSNILYLQYYAEVVAIRKLTLLSLKKHYKQKCCDKLYI